MMEFSEKANLSSNTPNLYFVDDNFLDFKSTSLDCEFSLFLGEMVNCYDFLRLEIAFCHKDIDKLFAKDEKIEKMETRLKKLKGSSYNQLSKLLVSLVNSHNEKMKQVELQIISDINALIQDIYFLSHYVIWGYDSFHLSPTLEEILFSNKDHFNKVLKPFNQNFEIKKACESIFELFKAFYWYKNKENNLAISYFNNSKALSYMPDFGGIVQSFNIDNGKKGGTAKGKKFAKPKKLALDYHDKYFAGKDGKGEFIYTAPKAAENIINELREKGHKEINEYGVNSLANIIRNHRK